MIILFHCWDESNARGILSFFDWASHYAVPVFVLMSFFFMQKDLVEQDKNRINNRFKRLFIPQVAWAIIYFLIYSAMDVVFDSGMVDGIGDLLWQLLTGHSKNLNPTMWYQVDLIILTVVFLLIIKMFKKSYEYILVGLAVAAVILQYSGAILILESLRYELKYPLGRLAEIIPVAVIGFLISSKNGVVLLKKYRRIAMGVSALIIIAESIFRLWPELPGFGYSGLNMSIYPLVFFILFSLLPLEEISERGKCVILFITRYTVGIYCMHRLVYNLLNRVISRTSIPIAIDSFFECVIIYIICFVCSLIGNSLVGKTRLRSLFN